MALKFNFKVTWTPQTIMIEEKTKFWKIHPKCCFWCLWPKCSFPYINSTHVENSSHFPHIEIYCQERLAIFPHILWCEERVSSHFPSPSSISSHFGCVELAATNFLTLFHTLVRAGKSNEKFLTFFQCVERSFPYINSTHAENSLLFPHFFLTFSSHWNFIVFAEEANWFPTWNDSKLEINSFLILSTCLLIVNNSALPHIHFPASLSPILNFSLAFSIEQKVLSMLAEWPLVSLSPPDPTPSISLSLSLSLSLSIYLLVYPVRIPAFFHRQRQRLPQGRGQRRRTKNLRKRWSKWQTSWWTRWRSTSTRRAAATAIRPSQGRRRKRRTRSRLSRKMPVWQSRSGGGFPGLLRNLNQYDTRQKCPNQVCWITHHNSFKYMSMLASTSTTIDYWRIHYSRRRWRRRWTTLALTRTIEGEEEDGHHVVHTRREKAQKEERHEHHVVPFA